MLAAFGVGIPGLRNNEKPRAWKWKDEAGQEKAPSRARRRMTKPGLRRTQSAIVRSNTLERKRSTGAVAREAVGGSKEPRRSRVKSKPTPSASFMRPTASSKTKARGNTLPRKRGSKSKPKLQRSATLENSVSAVPPQRTRKDARLSAKLLNRVRPRLTHSVTLDQPPTRVAQVKGKLTRVMRGSRATDTKAPGVAKSQREFFKNRRSLRGGVSGSAVASKPRRRGRRYRSMPELDDVGAQKLREVIRHAKIKKRLKAKHQRNKRRAVPKNSSKDDLWPTDDEEHADEEEDEPSNVLRHQIFPESEETPRFNRKGKGSGMTLRRSAHPFFASPGSANRLKDFYSMRRSLPALPSGGVQNLSLQQLSQLSGQRRLSDLNRIKARVAMIKARSLTRGFDRSAHTLDVSPKAPVVVEPEKPKSSEELALQQLEESERRELQLKQQQRRLQAAARMALASTDTDDTTTATDTDSGSSGAPGYNASTCPPGLSHLLGKKKPSKKRLFVRNKIFANMAKNRALRHKYSAAPSVQASKPLADSSSSESVASTPSGGAVDSPAEVDTL